MEHGTQNILNFLLKKMFPITSRGSDPSCKIISVLVSASGCFDVWYVWFLNIWKFFRHRNFSQLLKRSEMEKKKNTSLAEWWCWLSDGRPDGSCDHKHATLHSWVWKNNNNIYLYRSKYIICPKYVIVCCLKCRRLN